MIFGTGNTIFGGENIIFGIENTILGTENMINLQEDPGGTTLNDPPSSAF